LGQNGCQGDTGCLRLAAEYRVSQKSEKKNLISGKYLKNCVKRKNGKNFQKASLTPSSGQTITPMTFLEYTA